MCVQCLRAICINQDHNRIFCFVKGAVASFVWHHFIVVGNVEG